MEAKELTKDISISQTYDIDNVEIFKAGRWNGDEYTTNDLDDMVSSFAEIGSKIKPFLKLGHDNNQKLLQKDGMPSAGWITSLKRVGDTLLAKFSAVPEKIYQLLKAKAYGRMSSEIFWNLRDNGKTYRRVVRAVALLGADTPAVTTLDDFIELYTENDYDSIKLCMEIDDMEDVKFYQDQINDLKLKEKELEDKVSQFSIELEEKTKKLSNLEGAQKVIFGKSVGAYVDSRIESGHILPAQKDFVISFCVNEESFEAMKSFVDMISPLKLGEEKSDAIVPEKKELKDDQDVLVDKINAYMEKHKVNYADAFTAIAYGKE